MTKTNTRARLLKLTGRRYRPVDLPGFGPLRVRSLSDGERGILEEYANHEKRLVKRLVFVLSLVEADSEELVFPWADEAGLLALVNELGELDGAIVDKIAGAAMVLNDVSEGDIKTLLGERDAS